MKIHVKNKRCTTWLTVAAIAFALLGASARAETVDGVVLEETTQLVKNGQGCCGIIWMDGYPIAVTTKTKVLQEPAGSTFSFRYSWSHIAAKAKRHSKSLPNLSSAAKLRANSCVVFHSVRAPNGTMAATKIQFWPNWIDPNEKKYNKKFVVEIHPPNYSKGTPGTIQYQGATPILILPDKAIQDWVSNLGNTLIPTYQKNLPDSDATKINFHFYVTHTFPARLGKYFVETIGGFIPSYQILYWDRSSRAFYWRPKANEIVRTVVADPNGEILIPDGILDALQNSAQLATLLSIAITSVIQQQERHSWPHFPGYYTDTYSLINGNWQTRQTLRIGIRQMYLAGYDIREAPYAWAIAQDKPVHNPNINFLNPVLKIPWYAAYAFNYISYYYADVDYSKLKRGEREYQQFLQELYKADPSLPRPQAQLEPQASTRPQAAAQPAPESSPATPTASAPPAASPVAPSAATPAITQAH